MQKFYLTYPANFPKENLRDFFVDAIIIDMNIEQTIIKIGDKERAKTNASFFKTSEGDIFLGIRVPDLRKYAKSKLDITKKELESLLTSKFHEVRMCGCIILRERVKTAPKETYSLFMKHVGVNKGINSWDLVDENASDIVGFAISPPNMEHEERLAFIEKSITSKDLWVNRVIIVATHFQIKKGDEKMLLYSAPRFLEHKHDLIHKAVGWMLREMGLYCGRKYLEVLINDYGKIMPRTMLRYAVEHFDEIERKNILVNIK